MNGLENIISRILTDAKTEADSITAEANKRAAEIRAEYEARAAKMREENDARIRQETEALLARAESSADNMRRDAAEDVRSSLLDRVYANVLASLKALPAEAYQKLLLHLLTDACGEQLRVEKESRELYGAAEEEMPDSYEILFNEKDAACGAAVLTAFTKTAKEALKENGDAEQIQTLVSRLTLCPTPAPIDGGLILRATRKENADRSDGTVEMNCSLSALLTDLRARTEKTVLDILFHTEG